MASQIGINVNIKSELEKLQGFRDEAKTKGAFKGPGGPEALSRIDGLLKMLQGLTDAGNDNIDDWKKIVSSVKTIYSELSQFSAKISKLSPELDKLYEGLRKKEQQINEWSNKKVSGIEGRTSVGKKIKNISERDQISFHQITKKGNVSKNTLSNPETILKNYKEGTLALRGKDGQEITDKTTIDGYLKQLSEEYDNHTKEITEATQKMHELSASIDQLKIKIKQQAASDAAAGNTSDGELLAKVETSSHNFNKNANKAIEEAATSNENSTTIDPSIGTIGNKAATGWSKAFKAITLYNLGVKFLKNAAKSAVQTVQDLDKYLTEQAMVTGKTRKETYGLLKSYQDLALQCGATTKEIAQVATEYMKQGKSTEDALILTEAAVKAAKVARVSVTDSIDYLTTALNGFQLAAEDAMAVSDKFAAIAAASATDYDELAIALSKVASQANLAGMSIDYTTALLTKGLETTREAPETMGTALKTIIARMRELGDYGETLDDGMDINNVESQLKYVGIALRDSNGELRSTEDVLDELGHKWDGLNKNQQAAIAKALAGTRQQARLIAMMEDYERVTELQEISQRSAGATSAQAAKYMEGMESAMNEVSVAWEKVTMAFTDSEFIIKFVKSIGKGLDVVADILDTTAGQVGVFGTIAAIGFTIVGNKMQEHAFAKKTEKLEKEKALRDTQTAILEKQRAIADEEARKKKLEDELKSLKNQKEGRVKEIQEAAKTKRTEIEDAALKQKNEVEQAALEKKNAVEQNIIELESKKTQAEINKEKYEQIVAQKLLNIEELKAQEDAHKKLLDEKKITKEKLLQAAAKAEEKGDTAKAEKLLKRAEKADAAYKKEEENYNARNYSQQINDEKASLSAYKGKVTGAENIIKDTDQQLSDAKAQKDQQLNEIDENKEKDLAKIEKDKQSQLSTVDKDEKSQIKGLDDEIAAKQAAFDEAKASPNIGIYQEELELLTRQKELLESQLSPIQAIASGITGWLTPIESAIDKITEIPKLIESIPNAIKGIGKKFSDLKKKLDISKISKKNEKAIKKEDKARKKSIKTQKDETKTTDKAVKAEEKEIKSNQEAAVSEGVETAGNVSSTVSEVAEAKASNESGEEDVEETIASTAAAGSEILETAGNVSSAGSEVLEDKASDASAASDTKEAVTSVTAASADAVESAGNVTTALTGAAESASAIPVAGWVIALAILALAGVAGAAAIGIGMAAGAVALSFQSSEKHAEKTADTINKLSSEIYELTQQANELHSIADDFDAIDEKVIKTKKDMEAMGELLDSAADTLSDDIEDDEDIGYGKGVSARDAYEQLTRDEDRRAFLDAEEKRLRDEANKKRQKELEAFNNTYGDAREKMLHSNEGKYVAARSAIYGINNNALYEQIDALKELEGADENALAATEALAQAMLEELDIEDALDVANEDHQETIKGLINELQDLEATEVFLNEDETFLNRVNAFKELTAAIGDNKEMLEALKAAYSEWDAIADLDKNILQFIDTMGLSIDEINELYAGYKNLQKAGLDITKEQYQDNLDLAMMQFDDDLSNFNTVIADAFSNTLKSAEDFDEAWNTIVSSIGDTFATGILDMGQNMDKFNNTIDSFYEKSAEWAELSESEKMEFITDNQDLFSGPGGSEMLAAFQSGDYSKIEEALKTQMDERTQQQLQEVRRTLAVEEARVGEDRNEAYIQSLKEYEEYLTNGDDLYKASLEYRLEKEEAQLEKYREYLEQEQEALTESLEKRKEAYEKYFDQINQEEEDEDYEEEADKLVNNLSKLGSSTDASSLAKSKELENQLEQLEEDRLKELRERAQEQVLENMDREVEEINEKFDKLLESEQALLAAMNGDLDNPAEYLSNLISSKVEGGATANQLEEYIGSLATTYGGALDGADLENIKVREENNQLFLTVNGQEVALDTTNEQNLFSAIMKALREVGVK